MNAIHPQALLLSIGSLPFFLAAPLAPSLATPTPVVVEASGAIEPSMDAFRALLGGVNNGATAGEQATGRREINWDGVPAAVTNVANFPRDFFNVNSPRGLVYAPGSRGLEVTNQSFVDVEPGYAGVFNPVSGTKVFAPIGKTISNLAFFAAGTQDPAAVSGFGVVFLDVDRAGSATIQLFGENDVDLGTFAAPVRSDARGASFVGVAFRGALIRRVRIVSGDAKLATGALDVTQGGAGDLVAMDDFLYGEPKATGE